MSKFRRGYQPHSATDIPEQCKLLDTLALKLVASLRQNARKSNRAVTAEIGVSASAVRNPIRRMQQEKQISFADLQLNPGGPMNAAFVGIYVHSGSGRAVCQALAEIPEVSFVATTLGRQDLICTLDVSELEQLTHLLHGRIIPIKGMKSAAPSHFLQQITHQSELGFIL